MHKAKALVVLALGITAAACGDDEETCEGAACATAAASTGGGGEPVGVEGTQEEFLVDVGYEPVGAPPDLPGTYYPTEVVLTGLEPGRCYRYTLDAEPARGGRVCTARPSGDPFTFLAIGDTNPALGSTEGLLEHVLAEGPDFTVHTGDIQYYASVFESWVSWYDVMGPMLQQGAFEPSIGNHESEIEGEFENYYTR